jgi:hypothetical protein
MSRIHDLVNADSEELIRVYSYQKPEGWRASLERGYLTGNHGHGDDDDFWEFPYRWMRDRMAERIPEFSGDLPVWAWPKRENGKKRIRDPYSRITALVPRKRILPSCYDLWHMHLNNGFIATSEEEYEEYESLYPKHLAPGADPEHQRHVERHWEMVFDIAQTRSPWFAKNYGIVGPVQLCVDRIYLTEIVDIKTPKV